MFTTISVIKNLLTLIRTLSILCLFSTIGCGNGVQNSVHMQDLQQRIKTLQNERDNARLLAKTTKEDLKDAETERDTALAALKDAETERDTARRLTKIAEVAKEKADAAKEKAETERDTARRLTKIAEVAKEKAGAAKEKAETERDTARRLTKIAEVAKERAEAAKKRAEAAKEKAETERDTARRLTKIAEVAKERAEAAKKRAEAAKEKAETERDTARRLTKIAEDRAAAAEEKVSLVPQATITNVRIAEKKKDIDIFVAFNIKNRKSSKGLVKASFYFTNGRPLRNKNGTISISEEFTPKLVSENLTVKLSMSYAELNIAQPSNLQFRFRIYDKSTEKFLDRKPYSKPFRYDPHKN